MSKTKSWALVAMLERNCLTKRSLSNNGHATWTNGFWQPVLPDAG